MEYWTGEDWVCAGKGFISEHIAWISLGGDDLDYRTITSTNKEILLEMIKEAQEKQLWIHIKKYDNWFSPSEFKYLVNNNKFLWGRVNFELKNPMEEVERLTKVSNNFSDKSVELQKGIKKESEDYLKSLGKG